MPSTGPLLAARIQARARAWRLGRGLALFLVKEPVEVPLAFAGSAAAMAVLPAGTD